MWRRGLTTASSSLSYELFSASAGFGPSAGLFSFKEPTPSRLSLFQPFGTELSFLRIKNAAHEPMPHRLHRAESNKNTVNIHCLIEPNSEGVDASLDFDAAEGSSMYFTNGCMVPEVSIFTEQLGLPASLQIPAVNVLSVSRLLIKPAAA